MSDKIIIAGGTGNLGKSIINLLQGTYGKKLFILTRGISREESGIHYIHWNPDSENSKWHQLLEDSYAIINLSGKSVNCRYNERNKEALISSRINPTLAIGKAISSLSNPPKVWINASSAAIFGNSGENLKYEWDATGLGFPAIICKKWEDAFNQSVTSSTKKVILRMGLVFQKDIGLLQPFVRLAKFYLGGKFGNGVQYISWIHEQDFQNIIYESLYNENYHGIIHCSSPYPVTNNDFMMCLRNTLKIPIGIPHPAWLLKLGSLIIGTESELLINGRAVVSGRLEQYGFRFKYPLIKDALQDLIH